MKNQNFCLEGKTAADLDIGQFGDVSALGRGRGFRAKMLGLGVRPGIRMEIIGGYMDGPRVIKIGRQRFMLGSEMLSGIFIKGEEV